jgi:hypothetical protein
LIFHRRAAAVSVALRLYERDHASRPDTLDALVPDYLPAIPVDPLDPAGGPIRYIPDAEHPRVYSVGDNGVDDGCPATSMYDSRAHNFVDLAFSLDPITNREISPDLRELLEKKQQYEQRRRDGEPPATGDEPADRP